MLLLFLPIVSSCDAIKLLLPGGVPEHQPDVLTVQTDNKRQTVRARQANTGSSTFQRCLPVSLSPPADNYQLTKFASPESPPRWSSCIQQWRFLCNISGSSRISPPLHCRLWQPGQDRVQSVYWNKTLGINLYLREPWLWKVLNITTAHMNSFICLNMLNTSKALWTQPSLIMAYNLV